jgi:hypothetical protein
MYQNIITMATEDDDVGRITGLVLGALALVGVVTVAGVAFTQTASVDDSVPPTEVTLVALRASIPASVPQHPPIQFSIALSPIELGFVATNIRIGNSEVPTPLVADPGSAHITLPAANCQFIRCGPRKRILDAQGNILPSVRSTLAGTHVRVTEGSNSREACVVSDCRCGDDEHTHGAARQQCSTRRYAPSVYARAPPHTMSHSILTYGSQKNRVTSVIERITLDSITLNDVLVFPAHEIEGRTGSAILGLCCTNADDPRLHPAPSKKPHFSSTFLHACWNETGQQLHEWTLAFQSTTEGFCMMGGPWSRGSVSRRIVIPFVTVARVPVLAQSIGATGDSYYITRIDAIGVRRVRGGGSAGSAGSAGNAGNAGNAGGAGETRWWRRSEGDADFPQYVWFDLGTNHTFGSSRVGANMVRRLQWSPKEDTLVFAWGDQEMTWSPEMVAGTFRVTEETTLKDIDQRFGGAPLLMLGMNMMVANAPISYTFQFDRSEIVINRG